VRNGASTIKANADRGDFNWLKFQADIVFGDRGQRDRPTALSRDCLHHASASWPVLKLS